MSHNVLIKHGWKVSFIGKSFTAYQLENMLYVIWKSGKDAVYEI